MSQTINTVGHRVTKLASSAIEANRLVKLDTTEGYVVATSAITDEVYGVSVTKATNAGDPVEIETLNGAEVRVVAGEALATIGAAVMPKASGAGKVAAASGATAITCGNTMQAAGGDGETITIQFRPARKSPANS